jgi:hypothetical protein
MPYVETVTLDPRCENILSHTYLPGVSVPGHGEPKDDPMCLWLFWSALYLLMLFMTPLIRFSFLSVS